MSDTEDREARYRRAREVLQGAGWLFDAYVNRAMAGILKTTPDEGEDRETLYMLARVATELKAGLLVEIEQYEADLKMMEKRDGR